MADPTIVLVHGAFADASGFRGLYDELLGEDVTVVAGAVPYFREHQLPDGGKEFTLAPEGFHESFCADVPAGDAAFYAITQRPLAGVALTEAAPAPAWCSRPAWAVFGTADRCIDPGVHRFSYDRMGATETEIEGASHVVMISHPKEVAQVVMTAVRTLR